jgi:hypothetical protein
MARVLPIIIILLALPLLAIGVILLVRRSTSTTHLTSWLILSGITGSVLTAFITFSLSTVPIAPYELASNAWYPIYWQILLSLYIGFGVGVTITVIAVSPFWLIKVARDKNRFRGNSNPGERPNGKVD